MSKLTKIAIAAACAAGLCFSVFAISGGARALSKPKAEAKTAKASINGSTTQSNASSGKKNGISVQFPGLSINVSDDAVTVDAPFMHVNVDGDNDFLDNLDNIDFGNVSIGGVDFGNSDYDYDSKDIDQDSETLLLSKKFEPGAFTSVAVNTINTDIVIKRTENQECKLEVLLLSGSTSLEALEFSNEIDNKTLQIKAYNPKYNGSIKNKPHTVIILSIPNTVSLSSVLAKTVNGSLVCKLVPSKEMKIESTNGDVVILARDCSYTLKSTNGTLVANGYTDEDGGTLEGTIGTVTGSILATTVNGDIILKRD